MGQPKLSSSVWHGYINYFTIVILFMPAISAMRLPLERLQPRYTQYLGWGSSPARLPISICFDYDPSKHNIKERGTDVGPKLPVPAQIESRALLETHPVHKRQQRVDLYCPNTWFQCQRNGWGGCCMVGSTCKWESAEQKMNCWWSCEGREPCGSSCCLDVHTCVNGICELTKPLPTTTLTTSPPFVISTTPPTSSDTRSLMICIDMPSHVVETHPPDTPKDDSGFWDSWSAAEKATVILGFVGFAFSAITILVGIVKFGWFQKIRGWLRKRRSRAGTPDGSGVGTNDDSEVGNGIPTGSGTGTDNSTGSRIYTPDGSGTVTNNGSEDLKGGLAIEKIS